MLIILSFFFFFSFNCFSQEKSTFIEKKNQETIPLLENMKRIFQTRANIIANQLDSFFATERADDEFGRSTIRLRSTYQIEEDKKPELINQYRINLRLPSLEEKFKWQYYFDKKEDSNKKDEKVNSNKENEKWLFNSDLGVGLPSQLTLRSRLRKNIKTFILIHRFYEQLTYSINGSGIQEETGLNSDIVLNHNTLFRFINEKKWDIREKKFSTSHGPSLFHRLTGSDALSYGIVAQSVIENQVWFFNQYQFSVNYRKNLYHQWIYFDFIPGVRFPKSRSFKRNPFIHLRLEAVF